ncbi:hypothetical protein OIDMADRAFT_148682 [Oidiodendron maius Zn]|uniref:Transcription factor domain-containing protein n=1 Tax=Oidiodendron maius (strain Zn) TaxID=913774 RepID=A0A0C3GWA4_OIDMZ|nr:hypothetical protein OIDMADRAFT_148682 [Oidiodendron maius Zn]
MEALEHRLEKLSSRLAAVDGSHRIDESSTQAVSTGNMYAPTSRDQIADGIEVIPVVAPQDTSDEGHQESIAYDDAWPQLQQPSIPSLQSIGSTPLGINESSIPIMPGILRHTQQAVVISQARKEGPPDVLSAASRREQEVTTLLERYRIQMQQYFPFVIVPPELTGAEARQRRPFLWRAVRMAALWREDARHSRLGQSLLSDLTEAALLRPYKSFDVVQGFLVLIAWYHWKLDKFQLTNLLGLLQSLCLSLNFGQDRSRWKGRVQNISDDALEQGRAYLGWYYLSTIAFTMSEKPEISPQTRFFDQLCNTLLSKSPQQPMDQWLVALVRIERLTQSIVLMRTSREMRGQSGVPLDVVVAGFQKQIDNLTESLSTELMLDRFLQDHMLVMKMMLYEVAISDSSFEPLVGQDYIMNLHGEEAISGFIDTVEMQHMSIQARIDLLYSCVVTIKSFLANHLGHVDIYLKLSYIASFEMTYCLKLCKRLITLRGVPGWEANTARDRMGLDDAMFKKHIEDIERLAVEVNAARSLRSSRGDGNGDEDADLLPICSRSLKETTKHPFECMLKHLQYILSLFTSKEPEETENSADIDITTPRAPHKVWNADQQRRLNTNLNHNAIANANGQESRSAERNKEAETASELLAPAPSPSPARGRSGGDGEPGAPLRRNEVSPQNPTDPTESLAPLSSGVISQISLWPRLLQ